MSWFLPFVLILALVWAAVGVLLARWLKQSGHAKPFKGKEWTSRDLYGGGVGFGKTGEDMLGGKGRDWRGECASSTFLSLLICFPGNTCDLERANDLFVRPDVKLADSERPIGLGQFGQGRMKGI